MARQVRAADRARRPRRRDAVEAAALAAAVGLRNIAGFLAGGWTSWREDKLDVERVERMSVSELHELWTHEAQRPQVLDVRETSPKASTPPGRSR